MSADFWAGYVSGAAGILIGNPLDLIKVRLQAVPAQTASHHPIGNPFTSASSLIRGATAPILGYGALNALLFMTYNRSLAVLSSSAYPAIPKDPPLTQVFVAGALGGLATWVISTPTELIKCRAQVSSSVVPQSSAEILRHVLRVEGIKGLYFGGTVTALRDSIGYGFYFWSYEIMTRWMREVRVFNDVDGAANGGMWSENSQEAAKVLLCGGIAGVITWASVFPLDVIKTRVQTQVLQPVSATSTVRAETPLLDVSATQRKLGAWDMAKTTYRAEGASVFFRGLGVCSLRAFIVNAAQWAVYEYVMNRLEPGRAKTKDLVDTSMLT